MLIRKQKRGRTEFSRLIPSSRFSIALNSELQYQEAKMKTALAVVAITLLQTCLSVPRCETKFAFASTCRHYIFEKECQPYQLAKCKPYRISRANLRCPFFLCTEDTKVRFNSFAKMIYLN